MAKIKKINNVAFTPEAPTVTLSQVVGVEGATTYDMDIVCTGSAGAKEVSLTIKVNSDEAIVIVNQNGRYTVSELVDTDVVEVKAAATSVYNTTSGITTKTITIATPEPEPEGE